MQFWPPDDEHMFSKHVEAWNKLIVKQNFCASSQLIAETETKNLLPNKDSCVQTVMDLHIHIMDKQRDITHQNKKKAHFTNIYCP